MKILHLFISFFLFLFCLTNVYAQPDKARSKSDWQQNVRYRIEAELDTTTKRLNGTMRIFYQNNSPDTLTKIHLQVPSNAYHDEENTAVKEMRRISGSNVQFDQQRHHKVTIQSLQFLSIAEKTSFPLQAYDFSDTILDLTLPYPVMPGDTLTLGINFRQDFSRKHRRKTSTPSDFVLWFPRLMVYNEDGWHTEPFHFLMESSDVYSEFADFEVSIRVPGNYIVVGSGEVVEGDPDWQTVTADTSLDDAAFAAWSDSIRQHLKQTGLEKGPRRVRFRAQNLHNFIWSASPKFLYYCHSSDVPIHIFFTKRTWLTGFLKRFDQNFRHVQQHFGDYPFAHLNIVKTKNDGVGYPMMVLLRGEDEFETSYILSSMFVPGIVASNGVKESWLAKGLRVYMGKSFAETLYGERGYDIKEAQEDMNWFEKQYPLPTLDQLLRNISRLYMESGQDEPIANTIYGYKGPVGTIFNAYLKADLFYEMLRYVVGDSVFKASTREFIRRHAFTHIQEEDLQNVFEDTYGEDLDWFFNQWLRDTPVVDYAKGKVEKRKREDDTWITKVEIKRKGDGIMPVEVELDLGDGQKVVKRWHGKVESGTVVFETEEKPNNVTVDPQDRIMDSNQLNNRPLRLEFRPDWPLLKYIHMPGDVLLVLWRPAIDYNDHDSFRLGFRTRSSYRAFYHNLTLKFMFGIESRELDAKVAYNHPLTRQNLFNRYYLMVRKNEGRFEADAHLSFRGSSGILVRSGRSLEIGLNYSSLLNDAYTFREVANDTGTFKFDEWEDKDILLAYAEGRIQQSLGAMEGEARVRLASSLPGGDAQFTKLSGRLLLSAEGFGLQGKVRGNLATSFGPDRLPFQDQFRAEGAAARERFQNDIVKTGEAWSSFSRRYVEGGGYLKGYAGIPLPAERYATLNLELGLDKTFWLFKLFGFYDTGRIWPTRSSASVARSDAGLGLSFLFEELQLFGGNLGLFSDFGAKVYFPLWLSDPLPGEEQRQFRWYFSLGKGL
ncbi:hypothetical protein GWO43_26455 [candidate division KSB1 bacterium]|nr:hypothetical protein [candidate division KSB1 bacterium]NIR70059.1 hypothetical protein [candidate division KSB1 bacterium]NIS27497.1 hypothetical protein [candidate division KSB1 bacterium]NIT74346.1 hypothetical protein [candidate division KSB1 bacterium]NIU28215.1 hypothetical protein [candidate division KSB1 bacterium]